MNASSDGSLLGYPANTRFRKAVRVVVVLTLSVAVFLVLASQLRPVGAGLPIPPTDRALENLKNTLADDLGKIQQVDAATLNVQAHEVFSLSEGHFLVVGSVGMNALGEPRAVFTMFEVDPEALAWRPAWSLDGHHSIGSLTAERMRLPNGDELIGFLGAKADLPILYLSQDGSMKPLGADGPAGFAPFPSDAKTDAEGRPTVSQ